VSLRRVWHLNRQRTLSPSPSWNASYPLLWIERILYPLQVYGSSLCSARQWHSGYLLPQAQGFKQLAAIIAPSRRASGVGGQLRPMTTVTTVAAIKGQSEALFRLVPARTMLSGNMTATNSVIGRALYRTTVGGTTLALLATLSR